MYNLGQDSTYQENHFTFIEPINTVLQKVHSSYHKYRLTKLGLNTNDTSQKWLLTVPLNVSGLCNLGHDILQKPRDKITLVSVTLHGWLKVLLV